MSANIVLGECICPVCKSGFPQEVRTAKTGKPYMNCDECGCQIFARQPVSVKILRGMAAPKIASLDPVKEKPLPDPAKEKPLPDPVKEKPLPDPVKEKTIFDIFN